MRKPVSTGRPRDVVELMADLVFAPIADQIKDATYSCYEIKVAC